jgi:hypothetical protein
VADDETPVRLRLAPEKAEGRAGELIRRTPSGVKVVLAEAALLGVPLVVAHFFPKLADMLLKPLPGLFLVLAVIYWFAVLGLAFWYPVRAVVTRLGALDPGEQKSRAAALVLALALAGFIGVLALGQVKEAIQPAVAWAAGVIGIGTFYLSWLQKQVHFDRQGLSDSFRDALDRLADKRNPMMRASAAHRLAELARRHIPGRSKMLTEENYRFFPRAVVQLAAALHMENDEEVRAEVEKVLRGIADHGKGGDQSLLVLLIRHLADANRAAWSAFKEVLGEYLAARAAPATNYALYNELHPIVGCCDFSTDPVVALDILTAIVADGQCEPATSRWSLLRSAEGWITPAELSADLARRIRSRAAQLKDTRDALTHALSLVTNRPSEQLPLLGCFMSSADLEGAHLIAASLAATGLEGAKLRGAHLQEADLSAARLEGADLRGADLEAALLCGARLGGARAADTEDGGSRRANFTGANWWLASFRKLDGNEDEELKRWLQLHFPKPEAAERHDDDARAGGSTLD